jgi:uncharacterized protein involved in exopolysaccharide biosynthesis
MTMSRRDGATSGRTKGGSIPRPVTLPGLSLGAHGLPLLDAAFAGPSATAGAAQADSPRPPKAGAWLAGRSGPASAQATAAQWFSGASTARPPQALGAAEENDDAAAKRLLDAAAWFAGSSSAERSVNPGAWLEASATAAARPPDPPSEPVGEPDPAVTRWKQESPPDFGTFAPGLDAPPAGGLNSAGKQTSAVMRHFKSGNQPRRIYVSHNGRAAETTVYVEDEEGLVHDRLEEFDEEDELEATDPGTAQLIPVKARPLAHLLVCIGENVGHAFPITGDELIIGRSPKSDVVLDDRKVSGTHCRIVGVGQTHRLVDDGSQNGVLVNAARVKDVELRHGDLVQIGRSVFRYWVGDLVHGASQSLQPLPSSSDLPDTSSEAVDVEYSVHDHTMDSSGPHTRRAMQLRPDQRWAYDDDVQYSAELYDRRIPPGASHARPAPEGDTSLHELLLQIGRVYAFFRPYWKSILVMLVLGVVAGGLSYFPKPPMQAANFQVELTPKVADNPVEEFERANVEFFRSAEQNFKSGKLIERTLQSIGHDNPDPALVAATQGGLTFGIVSPLTPNTYEGRYQHVDADYAKQFLEAHVNLYLQTEIDKTLKVIKAEADFLLKQLEKTETDLRRTEEELLTFKKDNLDGLPAQARQYYDYLFELQRKQQEVGKNLDAIRSQLNAGQAALQTEKPMIATRVVTTNAYEGAITDVKRRIAEAKATGKGEGHPDVLALKRELAALEEMAKKEAADGTNARVEQSANPQHRNLQTSVHELSVAQQVTQKEAERLKADYERVKQIVAKLPELEARYADLTRSYDSTKTLHARIFNKLKTATVQLDLERTKASARYDIISPPTIEIVSVPRTIAKRGVAGGFLGLLLGLALAAARQVKKELFL